MWKTLGIIFFLILVLSFTWMVSWQNKEDWLPQPVQGEVIHHLHYSLSYSEAHEQPEWVYYSLNPERIHGPAKRKDNFREDPLVLTGSAQLADYRKSGYDRGHLSPAADNSHTEEAMSESFYMSNMSPQSPSFNRGIWKKLEEQFREWALEKGTLHIVTAGVLHDSLPSIGTNNVSIPSLYYKIGFHTASQSMIAFLMPNRKSDSSYMYFTVPVDSIESLTGIDFFYQLPDSLEDIIESGVPTEDWSVK